jgi:hypothetical protein
MVKLGTAYWSSSLTRSMNSGVDHGRWYARSGGGRAVCGNCGQAVACAGACGDGGHGSQVVEGASDGARIPTRQRGRRSCRPSLRQRGLTKLDGEAFPHSELVELAIGHCDGNGLLLANVWWLGFRIPRQAAVIVGVVSTLDLAVGRGLVLDLL